jgi:hypothetical protein
MPLYDEIGEPELLFFLPRQIAFFCFELIQEAIVRRVDSSVQNLSVGALNTLNFDISTYVCMLVMRK